MKKIIILTILSAILFIGCTTANNQTNTSNQNANIEVNDEEQIKSILLDHYKLLGERKFGDDFDKCISTQGNPTKKEYVDIKSQKGSFVASFETADFNYVEIEDNKADVSVTTTWNLTINPIVNSSTYNFSDNQQLIKENSGWKIIWNKEKDISDTNTNN